MHTSNDGCNWVLGFWVSQRVSSWIQKNIVQFLGHFSHAQERHACFRRRLRALGRRNKRGKTCAYSCNWKRSRAILSAAVSFSSFYILFVCHVSSRYLNGVMLIHSPYGSRGSWCGARRFAYSYVHLLRTRLPHVRAASLASRRLSVRSSINR